MQKMMHKLALWISLLIMLSLSSLAGVEMLLKTSTVPSLAKTNRGQDALGIQQIDEILIEHHVNSIKPVFDLPELTEELSRWVICEFADETDLQQAMYALAPIKSVLHVQPNRAFHLDYTPNDSLYQQQYALAKINAPSAWELERGSRDVLIAVIDTGIDYNHPDLANLWINEGEDINGNGRVDDADFNHVDDDGNGFIDDLRGWDFTDAPNYPDQGDYLERDNNPMDEHGHGTGVAGIIAAEADNVIGIAGLAHHCRIINLRAFNASGYGEEDDVASALLYAVSVNARIVNMSFGDTFVSRVLEDVIRYAYSQGITMIASAGNSHTDQIHYPSGFAETISVGSSDEQDQLSSFSNYGTTVDLVAPGSSIISTALDGGYQKWNGTSFSAPFVSAAAGLIAAHFDEMTPDGIRARLVDTAYDLGANGWDAVFGAGRLDVYRALSYSRSSIVQISHPRLDAGFAAGPIVIRGSAWSPYFLQFELYYGKGVNPSQWTLISSPNFLPVLDDILTVWETPPEEEGEYTLKLVLTEKGLKTTVHMTRIFIDPTPPQIHQVQLIPMVDADRHSVLIQYETDDLCEGSVYYRRGGEGDFQEIPLSFRTRTLRYNLTQANAEGMLDLYFTARNSAGLMSSDDANGRYYPVDLTAPPLDVTRFTPNGMHIPFGRVLSSTSDFNANGMPELITSIYEDGAIGAVKFYEWQGGEPVECFSSDRKLIPRAIGDSDGDGNLELLCGLGIDSYLYEAGGYGQFPDKLVAHWQGDGSRQYWASRFADLDLDGRGEILMRVVQTASNSTIDQFQVYEYDGDQSYTSVAQFTNPTAGDNFNGVPHCEIGDMDGDGQWEILLGDSDGDLYIYENRGDNYFAQTWQDSLPLLDSIDFIQIGDFDGDGVDEFIAGCHSDANLNTEHDYDARHWYYRLYEKAGNDQYFGAAEWWIFGYESTRDYLSSVSAGDVDDDGMEEIFIVAYPDLYVIDFESGAYSMSFYSKGVQTGAIPVTDFNKDGRAEFWAGNGKTIYAFESVGQNTGPAVPVGVMAHPLDEHTINLNWRTVQGADSYIIFRGRESGALFTLAETSVPFYQDLELETDSLYYYAIQTIDRQLDPPSGRLSQIVSARPGRCPALLQVEGETAEHIRVIFSEPMSRSAISAAHYKVMPLDMRPTSAAFDRNEAEILLTFPFELVTGQYQLITSGLTDRDLTPIDTLQSSAVFSITPTFSSPYLKSAEFLDFNLIRVEFSQDMVNDELRDTSRYLINDQALIKEVHIAPASSRQASLVLQELFKLTAGDTVILRVRQMHSLGGQEVRSGRGDRIQLIYAGKTEPSERVNVFPNPFLSTFTEQAVTFVHLAPNDQITILTSQGQVVARLKNNTLNNMLNWDLTNDRGERVASGVYLFRIDGRREYIGKLAIIR